MITNEPSTQQEQEQQFVPSDSAALAAQQVPGAVLTASEPAPDNRFSVWLNLLKAFGVWVASIILLVAAQLAFGIPYFLYVWLTTGGPPAMDSFTSDKALAFLAIVSVLPAHLLTLGLIWLVVTQGRKVPFWPTIDFHWPKNTSPAAGTIVCLLIAAVLFMVGATATYFWGGSKTQLDLLVESSIPARMATAIIAVFTAPLVEELIYRGVLYSAIERALGTVIAVGVVSLLFAGVHVFQYIDNLAVIMVITLLSFTLTVVRAKTGSVLAPFVIHLGFNGIQSIFIALSPFINWAQSS